MSSEIKILIISAASIGFFHTLTGPDHYLPFVVLSKARKWSLMKSSIIVAICGLGHVASSIILGIVGVATGIGLHKLVGIEGFRGSIAAWMIIGFGGIYGLWGIYRAMKKHSHSHTHFHNGVGNHKKRTSYKQLTPWILFVIFVFGPCEPLIPLLIFPAAEHSMGSVFLIAGIFGLVTIATMLTMFFLLHRGISFIKISKLERYSHALAGFTIFLSGLGIQLLGL